MCRARPSKITFALSLLALTLPLALPLALPLTLMACNSSKPKSTPTPTTLAFTLDQAFPAANAIPGWNISQAIQSYHRDNLYSLVDGQADSFFVYGFEQVVTQRYQNADQVNLNVEIWQLATPADAYGLFTAGRAGEPVAIGNEGDSDPGRRLAFWQNRYFVSLSASPTVPDETLWAYAKAITSALPSGGERPLIVSLLPQANLVERSALFFHEEISVQMEVWLGGENILGLSQATNGAIARYNLGEKTARLILIEYPAADQASAALQALQASDITDLLAAGGKDNLLGAVFGNVDAVQAQSLLEAALP
jgi:hypothetical protein